MAGGIDELIDVLYGMVEEAWSMPLGKDKCLIERERVLDILDELRVNLPGEIKAARDVVERRNELISAGKRDADAIVKQAEERQKQILNTDQLVTQSKKKAAEIIASAEGRSRDIKKSASEYCDDILKQTEQSITNALSEIRRIRKEFNMAVSTGASSQSAPPPKAPPAPGNGDK